MWRTPLVVALALLSARGAYCSRPPQYIIVSSPTTQNIYYAELPTFHDLTLPVDERPLVETKVLIDGEASKCKGSECTSDSDAGLLSPQGLALHHGNEQDTLYVSDCEAQSIYAYQVVIGKDGELSVGTQKRVRTGVEGGPRWLSVDGLGNLYYTAYDSKQVEMISNEDLSAALSGNATAKVLYSGDSSSTVAGPAGVVADAYSLYWANQDGGADAGAVVKALTGNTDAEPTPLTSDVGKAYGVCIVNSNAFFTAETRSLFAVQTTGGTVQEVSSAFDRPRGCAYDKENTLYVADRGASAVYSLPANFHSLRSVKRISKVMSVDQPCQLAVLHASHDDKSFGASLRAEMKSRATHSYGGVGVLVAVAFGAFWVQ